MFSHNAVIDDVLGRYAAELGAQYDAYRNHVLRAANYHVLLTGKPLDTDVALAWAVHDLGVWTARTVDYIQPSAALARELAPQFGIADASRAAALVEGHHALLPFADPELEAFRKADLIDFSRGLLREGLSRDQIATVSAAFPNAGFHRFLARELTKYAVSHPLRPFPMVRLR